MNLENKTTTLDPKTPALDPIDNTENQQITSFVDDAAIQRSSLPNVVAAPLEVTAPAHEARVHQIEDILNRPTKIGTFTWSASWEENYLAASYNFPTAITDASSIIAAKLQNFTYLRADVKIRVVVNAQPFQQGRILAYFSPFAQEAGTRATYNENLTASTAFPHVNISAAGGNSGELTIPYVSPYSHYNLVEENGDLGSLFIRVLNPIATSDATVTVFAWFDKIDLSVPTPALPLSSSRLGMMGRFMSEYESPRMRAQAGEMEEKSKQGVVSRFAAGIEQSARSLSGLPLIGRAADTVAWVSKGVKKTAEYFGLNKPHNMQSVQRFHNIPAWGYSHGEGLDNSFPLGLKPDNELVRENVFGSNVDEMDINYIISHMNYVQQFDWSVDNSVGTSLYKFPVSPGYCNSISANVFEPTLLAFVGGVHKLWRGSLKYKIQVTKTAYHSGRLRIGFIPSANSATTYNLDQSYNWILDLRESDEIEFEIPFVSQTSWKQVKLHPEANIVDFEFQTGILQFEVLNQLRAASSAPSTINVNIWIGAGSDFGYSIPFSGNYVPTAGATMQAQVLGHFQDSGFNKDLLAPSQMFAMRSLTNLDAEKLTIGECVHNVRELIHRATQEPVDGDGEGILSVAGWFGRPDEPNNNMLDYFSWIYRFWRGSIRYKYFLEDNLATDQLPERFFSVPFALAKPAPTTRGLDVTVLSTSYLPQHSQVPRLNPYIEMTVPYYSNTPIKLISDGVAELPGIRHSVIGFDIRPNEELFVYKGAGDDFDFGWLVGPPLLKRVELFSPTICEPDYTVENFTIEVSETLTTGQSLTIPIDVVGTQTGSIGFSTGQVTLVFQGSGQGTVEWLRNGIPFDTYTGANNGTGTITSSPNLGTSLDLGIGNQTLALRLSCAGGTVTFTSRNLGTRVVTPILRVCEDDARYVVETTRQDTITSTPADQTLTISDLGSANAGYYSSSVVGSFNHGAVGLSNLVCKYDDASGDSFAFDRPTLEQIIVSVDNPQFFYFTGTVPASITYSHDGGTAVTSISYVSLLNQEKVAPV